jgi:hypothetical protein
MVESLKTCCSKVSFYPLREVHLYLLIALRSIDAMQWYAMIDDEMVPSRLTYDMI